VRRLVDLDRDGRVDGAYTIFALMCTELWCRQFVDAVPEPLTTPQPAGVASPAA